MNAITPTRQASPSDLRAAMLDSRVCVEPLVDRWYAWPHLLAPAQQALNLAFRYIPTLRSFASAPAVHLAASRDPEMYGGPFVDLPEAAVEAVQSYLERTERERADALAFARAFREFDRQLQSADGFCLDDFRETAPDVLRGRIELVYDLNNHPKVRLLEEMFAADDLGHARAQELMLHREEDAVRPFFLSAPRLDETAGAFLRIPFASDEAALLSKAHTAAIDVVDLAERLGGGLDRIAPYFVDPDGPRKAEPYVGDGVRVRYFGHASVLVETSRTAVLIDPTGARGMSGDGAHFVLDELPPKIDVLFLSHGHQDHLSPEALLRIRDRVEMVVIPPNNRGEPSDPSLSRMLAQLGFTHVRTMEPLQTLDLADGCVRSLPFTGEHCDLDVHSKHCALIELKGRRLCVLVDTDAIDIDVYQRLAARLENADLLLLGMECFGAPLSWLYGPLAPRQPLKRNDDSRRMSGANERRAWAVVDALRPKRVGVYAMGQEPWMRHVMGLNYKEDSIQLLESDALVRRCREGGIPAERLYLKMETVL